MADAGGREQLAEPGAPLQVAARGLRQRAGAHGALDQGAVLDEIRLRVLVEVQPRRGCPVDPLGRVRDHHLRLRVDLGKAIGVDRNRPAQASYGFVAKRMRAKASVAQPTQVSRQPIGPDLHASDYPGVAQRLQRNPPDDPPFWVRAAGPRFLV